MIKKLIIYLSALLAFTACSDEDFSIPGIIGEDGEIAVRINVPEMTEISTRATVKEWDIDQLTILVVSDGKVKQQKTFSGDSEITLIGDKGEGKSNDYYVTLKIDKSIRGKSDLKFVALANPTVTVNDDDDYSGLADLETLTVTSTGTMPMYGEKSLADVLKRDAIPLKHVAAKVTVLKASEVDKDAADINDRYTEDATKKYAFNVYATAEKAHLFGKQGTPHSEEPEAADVFDSDAVYVCPTTASNGSVRPYVIVKAEYPADKKEYFYRVNFEKIIGSGDTAKVEALDIESNHHYKVYVLDVLGTGYATAAEAAKNPVGMLETVIIDVCPQSYNMVTDGVRELGVSHEVVFPDGSDWGTERSMFVKVYSQDPKDMQVAITADDIDFDVNWLEVGDITEGGSNLDITVGNNFKGKIYKVKLRLIETSEPGSLETNIIINWCGLSRSVNVKLDREFNALSLCSAKLIMKEGENVRETINDYWTFLSGVSAEGLQLHGVGKGETGDSIRNEGLHFPVMYGNPTNWTYEYELEYEAPIKDNAYDWSFSTLGIDNVTVSPSSGSASANEKVKVTVKCSDTDYNYQVGTLRMTVKSAVLAKPIPLNIDLYHTGFFHRENDKYEYSGDKRTETGDFCYYEVLKEKGVSGKYWLDRNIGAHTNVMYVETLAGNAYYPEGPKLNAGGYYHGCKWGSGTASDGYTYNKARAYEADLCPPGWEIPTQAVFSSLRASKDFRTSQIGTYFDSSLAMDGNRRMYFPKYCYYDGTNRTGASRAGYYWTKTPADGLEKEEIQKFMQTFVLEGTNPGFERALADQSESNLNGAAMAVRCIHKDNNQEGSSNLTYFNVAGATHVYLYTEDAAGNRTAATNWPGHFIGNYQNMTMNYDDPAFGQNFYFSYTSTTARAQDLYVIFNYTDENGQIHSFSRRTKYNGNDSSVRHTIGTSPTSLNGWKVVGDQVDGKTTALGGYWAFAYDGTVAKIDYRKENVLNYTYKIKWYKDYTNNNNVWKIYVEYADGTKIMNSDFSEGNTYENNGSNAHIDYSNESYPIYTFPTTPLSKQMIIRFNGVNTLYYDKTVVLSDFTLQSDNKTMLLEISKADLNTSPPEANRYKLIYFYNIGKWSNVKVKFMVNNIPDGFYQPGEINGIITQFAEVENIKGYVVKAPSNSTLIEFSNGTGATVTVNQSDIKSGQIYFNLSGYEIPETGKNRIIVQDNNIYRGYTTNGRGVYIHYWGDSNTSWPGVEMNRITGTNLYWYDFKAPNFIICNGVKDSGEPAAYSKRQTNNKSYSDDFIKGDFFVASKERD